MICEQKVMKQPIKKEKTSNDKNQKQFSETTQQEAIKASWRPAHLFDRSDLLDVFHVSI